MVSPSPHYDMGLLAWVFLAQPITPQFGIGTVLVIAGVVLTQVG